LIKFTATTHLENREGNCGRSRGRRNSSSPEQGKSRLFHRPAAAAAAAAPAAAAAAAAPLLNYLFKNRILTAMNIVQAE
jgi:hypothetical protein